MTAVVMPEAPVHENYCCMTGKDKIWCSGKVAPVEPEAKTKSMRN